MDQDGGRFEAQSVSRAGTDANVGLLCGGRLPSAPYGAAEPGQGGVSGARRPLAAQAGAPTPVRLAEAPMQAARADRNRLLDTHDSTKMPAERSRPKKPHF
jgi:hypothetical protein